MSLWTNIQHRITEVYDGRGRLILRLDNPPYSVSAFKLLVEENEKVLRFASVAAERFPGGKASRV